MTRNNPRTWIWIFVIVEFVGLAVDALWHGVLHRDFDPGTSPEMVRHLATVHLPLYIGVLGLLGSTTWALLARVKRGKAGIALPLAVMGAAGQTVGEAWHAYSHLTLRPNPLPELVGFAGLLTVIVSMLGSRRALREWPGEAASANREHRASRRTG
jgi:hypothetical protein